MLKGFKDFIMRGNVIDLAVAVVIGTAFAAVVKAVTDNLIAPVLAAAGGNKKMGWGFHLVPGNDATFMNFGALLSALINFLIVAAVVYFVFVMPMNKLAERRKRGEEPEPEVKPEDVQLLTEIRDLLRRRAAQS